MNVRVSAFLTVSMLLSAATVAVGQDSPGLPAPGEDVESAFPEVDHFSPYAARNFPTNVYWGDTHRETGMSREAGAICARLRPEHALRFARGE